MTRRHLYLILAAIIVVAATGSATFLLLSTPTTTAQKTGPRKAVAVATKAAAPASQPAGAAPQAPAPQAANPAPQIARLPTMLTPMNGALLPGLRRGLAPEAAPAAATAPQATAPIPDAATPAQPPAAPQPTQQETAEAAVNATVSFPQPPAAKPAEPVPAVDNAETTPLPPVRPRDLVALTTPAPDGAAPAPQPIGEAQTVDAPLPPTRPTEFSTQQTAAATGAASAPAAATQSAMEAATSALKARFGLGTQTAALPPTATPPAQGATPAPVPAMPEPALRAAPEDAFRQPPPRFGMGDQVFVRIFKQEGQLELWLRKSGRFHLYKTFPICKWSGRLGPKQKEADYQSPEGFYSVSARQLNPHSNYHRAFNVGYPNAFDRQNGRTGGLVMVHGACKSVGCFAMTDRGIEEIYGFVEAALKAGQREIAVHIFPFRMTDAAIARETGGGWLAFVGGANYQQWNGFWRNLKQGYDMFEQTGEPPTAYACGDHYAFDGSDASCRRVAGW